MTRKPVGLTAPYRADDDDDIQDYKKPWVGLTDEQIQECYETTGHYQTLRPQDRFAVFALARAIEEALRRKNT